MLLCWFWAGTSGGLAFSAFSLGRVQETCRKANYQARHAVRMPTPAMWRGHTRENQGARLTEGVRPQSHDPSRGTSASTPYSSHFGNAAETQALVVVPGHAFRALYKILTQRIWKKIKQFFFTLPSVGVPETRSSSLALHLGMWEHSAFAASVSAFWNLSRKRGK